MTSGDWGRSTSRGLIWSTASLVGGRALTFVSIAILARLLAPAEFGVVAAVVVFISLLEMVSDVGMKATVVYEQERGITARVQTAFTVNLGFAIVLTAAALTCAPLAAGFFRLEEHTGLFRMASLSLLLTGLGNVHDSLLMRELDFRRRIVPELARGVVRGGVSIALALGGWGADALVIGMLAGTATWTALQWVITPFRPTLSFDRAILHSMVRYASGAAMHAILVVVNRSVPVAAIGRALGEQALGFYTIALRVPELMIGMVAVNVSRVSFPALAQRRATDEQRLSASTLMVLRYQALYVAPVAAAIAVLSTPLIVVLFSAQWTEAGGVLSALAVLSGVATIAFPLGDALKAVGKQWLLVALNAVQIPILGAAIVVVAPRGIAAVGWAMACAATVFALALTMLAAREVGIRLRSIALAAGPGLVAALGVIVGAGAVRTAWPAPSLAPLACGAVAGAAGAALFLALFAPGVLSELRALLAVVHPGAREEGLESSRTREGHSP